MKDDETLHTHESVCGRWEPIETAPKDGTEVVLYRPGLRPTFGCYTVVERYEGWIGWWFTNRKEMPPTHWLLLPPRPDAPDTPGSGFRSRISEIPSAVEVLGEPLVFERSRE